MFSIVRSIRLPRILAFCSLLLLAACGGGGGGSAPPNPDPPAPSPTLGLASTYTDIGEGMTLGQEHWGSGSGTGQPIDGIQCVNSEAYHIHSIVSIYLNGTRLALPAEIGLKGCTYEIHTHDESGFVHMETEAAKKFTLGQFFSVWGQALGTSEVAGLTGIIRFYLIDNETVTPYTGNPADIEFASRREIAIVVGTPPDALVRHRWPAGM